MATAQHNISTAILKESISNIFFDANVAGITSRTEPRAQCNPCIFSQSQTPSEEPPETLEFDSDSQAIGSDIARARNTPVVRTASGGPMYLSVHQKYSLPNG
jgi:hypothetical protein